LKSKNRKLPRKRGYDYSNPGGYFVTICTKFRDDIFDKVIEHKMVYTEYGDIANNVWQEIPKHYPYINLDEYIIMPDHIHGILWINDMINGHINTAGKGHALSLRGLSTVIGSYKSAVSKKIHELGIFDFKWQTSFHDRIIRSDDELIKIRNYIVNNPKNCLKDKI
jgi:putative transposase